VNVPCRTVTLSAVSEMLIGLIDDGQSFIRLTCYQVGLPP
jgi:hypothetical protein